MYCSKCGQPNVDTAKFCASCGSTLNPVSLNKTAPILPGFNQTSSDPDALYRAFIGPKNQQYYLAQFHQFDRAGQTSATWHWPAFFVTWYWLLYRKMWLNALIYFVLPYIIVLVGGFFTAISPGLGGAILGFLWLGYLIGVFVWYPMYANALYYKHCQKKIQEAKATSSSPDVQLAVLAARGGTSGIIIIVIVIFVFISLIGIMAAISIPAYQDYITRSKVTQAVILGEQAEVAVTQYYQQQQALPATLADAGFKPTLPQFVKKVELDESADGTIAISLTNMPMSVNDAKIYLVPSLEADKSISWKCSSPDLKDRFLPVKCRPQQ